MGKPSLLWVVAVVLVACSKEDPPPPPNPVVASTPPPAPPPAPDPRPEPGEVFREFLALATEHRAAPSKAISKPYELCNTDEPEGLDHGFCHTLSEAGGRFVVWNKRSPKAYRFESEGVVLKRQATCEDFDLARVKRYTNEYEMVDYCEFSADGPMAGFSLYVRNGRQVPESFLVVFSPTFLAKSDGWRKAIETDGR